MVKKKGVVLPIIVIVSSVLMVIVLSTTVIVGYLGQQIDYDTTQTQLQYLAESSINMSVEEIKNGINLDNSDTDNIYCGIGIIDTYVLSVIRYNKTINAIITCSIIDELDKNYIIESTAYIPSLNVKKIIDVKIKVE